MAGPKRSHGEPERVTSGRETVSCQAADLGERAPYGLDNQLPTETRDGERAPDPLVLVSPSTEGDPFHTFWRTYPRRVGKPEAERAYRAVVKLAAPDVILAGLARWVTYWTARGEPEFTPHPSTWLRRHGWEDEPPPVKGASGQPGGPMGVVDEDRDGPSGRIFL